MARKKYSSWAERALDPIRFSKFYAKGYLGSWMKRNPKAAKSTKLRVWRESYLTSLFEAQKKK